MSEQKTHGEHRGKRADFGFTPHLSTTWLRCWYERTHITSASHDTFLRLRFELSSASRTTPLKLRHNPRTSPSLNTHHAINTNPKAQAQTQPSHFPPPHRQHGHDDALLPRRHIPRFVPPPHFPLTTLYPPFSTTSTNHPLVSVLLINAIAILSEDRFLARIGWGSSSSMSEPSFGGPSGGGDASMKAKLVQLISSVRTLMRIPLIFLNVLIIVWAVAFG